MAIVVAIVLGVLALAFVLYPLYRRSPGVAPVEDMAQLSASTLAPVDEQEESARAALQEVEFDYQLGNISEADYRSLRERYMQRALVAFKSRYERDEELDQEIERELNRLKEANEETDS